MICSRSRTRADGRAGFPSAPAPRRAPSSAARVRARAERLPRCLIIACGCRGGALAGALRDRGHAVRATTRNPSRVDALEALGAEAVLGDPDRVATLVAALDHVAVTYILLGSATGPLDALQALHSTRLDMLLSKILDSTTRAIVYEAAGSVPAAVLEDGARRVTAFCEDSRVPYALLRGDPADYEGWLAEAVGALDAVLAA